MSIQPPVLNVFNINQSASVPNHVHAWDELLTETFVVPAINGQTTIKVVQSSQYQIGMWVWIQGAGFFRITGIPDATHIYVINDGATGTQSAGTVVPVNSILMPSVEQPLAAITPSISLYDILTQPFTAPAVGSSASAYIEHIDAWGDVGLTIYIEGAGYYTITAVDTVALRATVMNASLNNAAAGTSIAVNSKVWPSALPNENIKAGVMPAFTPTTATDDEHVGDIVFGTPFASVPKVVVSFAPSTDVGGVLVVSARSITANGFSVYSSNTAVGSITIDVHWIASIDGNL